MNKLNVVDTEILRTPGTFTGKLECMAATIDRMLKCGDITIAEQKELKLARKSLMAAWNTIAKNTHL